MGLFALALQRLYLRRDGSSNPILSPIVILRTPVDIFPEINIPVISIIWQGPGSLFSPQRDGGPHRHQYREGLTTTVNDIELTERNTAIYGARSRRFLFTHSEPADPHFRR